MADALEALLQEGRTFPPPEQFRKDALDHRRDGLRRSRARLAGPLGHTGARARLVRGVAHDPRVGPAVREVVRRRQAQRRVQLPRPPRRGRPRRPGRVPLGRRARRHARASRIASCSTSRAASPTCSSRSASRRATGSRSTWAWCPSSPAAMLACARIGAPHSVVFGGFTAAVAARPHQRRRGQGAHHRRRRVAARLRRRAQGHRRRSASRRRRRSSTCSCCAAPRTTSRCRRPRPLVARHRAAAVGRVPARADGQRGPALHPLHVGHHREAQGHHAHDRRLPHAVRVHAQVRLRPPARHATCTGAPPTSAG